MHSIPLLDYWALPKRASHCEQRFRRRHKAEKNSCVDARVRKGALDSVNEIVPSCRAQHCVIAGILRQGISSQLVLSHLLYTNGLACAARADEILHMLQEVYRKRAVTTF